MKRLYSSTLFFLMTAIVLMAFGQPVWAENAAPIAVTAKQANLGGEPYHVYLPAITGGSEATGGQKPATSDPLEVFIDSVTNGTPDLVVGAYAEDVLAMPVVQQPDGNSNYISIAANTITQFGAADNFGTTGLLAHNTHAGEMFFDLQMDQEIVVVYGDGSTRHYLVQAVRRFQALEPTNPYSDFIDLETGERLSATDLFYQVYTGEHHVTFQTCIEQDGNPSWGRIFILAHPLD